jgi:lipoic acid synthetase
MAEQMGTKYLVITSVNRDDLPDGGAGHFHDCINQVRNKCPNVKFEILTPDFRNCQAQAIEILADALPFVFAHNIETVPSLYRKARPGGNYQRSLNLLKLAKETYPAPTLDLMTSHHLQGLKIVRMPHIWSTSTAQSRCGATKSSIMLGLGETDAEVEQTLKDLRDVGCDRITIGQYLKPSKNSLEVVEYIPPAKFDWWKKRAIELGFNWVISTPFARSSYFADIPSIQSAAIMSPLTGE